MAAGEGDQEGEGRRIVQNKSPMGFIMKFCMFHSGHKLVNSVFVCFFPFVSPLKIQHALLGSGGPADRRDSLESCSRQRAAAHGSKRFECKISDVK